MKIINDTDLSYEVIGMIIDKYISDNPEGMYIGQIMYGDVEISNKKIRVQVRCKKTFTEWRFYENN